MERLTNKNNNGYTLKVKGDCIQAIYESHQEQEKLALNKLGQLEDLEEELEEELGIDLITYFTLRKGE